MGVAPFPTTPVVRSLTLPRVPIECGKIPSVAGRNKEEHHCGPVSPVRAAAPIPAEATGRERVMSGLPAGRYTIGFVFEYCRTQRTAVQ